MALSISYAIITMTYVVWYNIGVVENIILQLSNFPHRLYDVNVPFMNTGLIIYTIWDCTIAFNALNNPNIITLSKYLCIMYIKIYYNIIWYFYNGRKTLGKMGIITTNQPVFYIMLYYYILY